MELAAAVVGALTEQAIKVVDVEVRYASECSAQLDHLIKGLDEVNGLLHDKVNLKVKAEQVKPLMIPLRQLIYEADDVITDCIVRDEYSNPLSRSCGFFLRHSTGKKLRGINSRLDPQLETLGTFLNKESLSSDEKSSEKEHGSQDINPNEVIGLDDDIKKIIDLILEAGKFHRVGVWGMGGLGKTTLVQKIFNDDRVLSSFEATIWVSVSKSFNKRRILTTVLNKLGGKIPEEETSFFREVMNAVARLTKGCLVVMDDVWCIDDVEWWNDFLRTLEVKGQRSCVIVTTRDKRVAETVAGGNKLMTHEARKLDEAQSWKLFSQYASPGEEFKEQGEKIVEKCGGLPLSIKTTGSLLAAKTKLSEWTDVLKYFHGNEKIGGNKQVIENLRLSYTELEPHLKQCLLCFSAYPEDSDISADQVIHWWLAEGLLQKHDSEKSALELGHEYLSALINTCLVEVGKRRSYDGKVYNCKIHDMVRDLIMTIAQEEGFCSFNRKGIPIWNEASYWLCLSANLMEEMNLKGKLSFEKNSKLRAVLIMPDHRIDLDKNSGVLSSLRMLDLSGGSGSHHNLDPKSLNSLLDWIGALTRLACLNLSGFQGLEELPSSIYKLRNLQLLVLSGCSDLKKLDASIAKLKKLIVLHLQNCPKLKFLPRGFEELHKLQELDGFTVTIGGAKSKGTCGLAELAKLTQLSVLHIVITSDGAANLEQCTDQWSKVLLGLKKLRILGIDVREFRNGLERLDSLCLPETLRELYLENYHGDKLPGWIRPSMLKNLEYLSIEDVENVTEWKHEEEVKWNVLEGLRLKDMKKLRANWAELKKLMPALRYLEVIRCGSLENLPNKEEMTDGIWRSTRKRT